LWLVDLERAAPALQALERTTPSLAADDRARARRSPDPRTRRQRLAAYIALRIVLERGAGPRVRKVRFVREPGGRPRLPAGDIAFSLSHAGGLALIGAGRARAIGVDLERTRPIRMSGRRREETLAAGAGLAGAPAGSAASDAALLQAWCRLEAFAKAQGRGLDAVLSDLGLRKRRGRELPPASIEAAARGLARAAGIRVGDVRLAPGVFGAIALDGMARLPRAERFPTGLPAILALLRPQVRSTMVRPRRRSIR
jgi:4'-phosphopantetheinyl transferase